MSHKWTTRTPTKTLIFYLVGGLSALFFSAPSATQLTAQTTQTADQPPTDEPKAKPDIPFAKVQDSIDANRRQELLEFVRENHPELERLIRSLREKRPRQYENAIRSLDRSVSQLQKIQDSGNTQRYQQQLENWKLNSRIQLLSAQLSMTDSPELRNRLRGLIVVQFDQRTEQLAADQEKLLERLKKVNIALNKAKTQRQPEIEKQYQSIVNQATRLRESRAADASETESNKTKNKNGEKKKSKNSNETAKDRDE